VMNSTAGTRYFCLSNIIGPPRVITPVSHEPAGMNENVFKLALCCCTSVVAVLALFSARRACRTGTVGLLVSVFPVARAKRPVLFWLGTGFQVLAAAFLLWLALVEAGSLLR